MAEFIFALVSLAALFALAMNRAALRAWALAAAIFTLSAQMGLGARPSALARLPCSGRCSAGLSPGVLFAASFPEIKRKYIALPAYRALKGAMPTISETEREALQAGTVGWDAELFSGTPDWAKLRRVAPITLTAEERAFLDGPTIELCKRLNDWRIRHELHDIPDDIWRFVCDNGFLGMLISKQHGGLGLLGPGAVAHSRQDLLAQPRRRHHRHGAELARPRRADREIRHRRAEGAFPAAARAWGGDPLLCADRSVLGLRRRLDARHRRRHARAA